MTTKIVTLLLLVLAGCTQILGIDEVRPAHFDAAPIDTHMIDARPPDAHVIDARLPDAMPACLLDPDPKTVGCSTCLQYGSDAAVGCSVCWTNTGDRLDGECCHFSCCHPQWPSC